MDSLALKWAAKQIFKQKNMSDDIRISRGNYKYAGFGVRLLAGLIDLVIGVLLAAIIIGVRFDFGADVTAMIVHYLWYDAVYFGFVLICWLAIGKTPGMLIVKLRLIAQDSGHRPGVLATLLRMLMFIVSWYVVGLGLLWIAFHPQKKGWHDLASKTAIVYKR